MNFKYWLFMAYGIKTLYEAKIFNEIHLPANKPARELDAVLLISFGAYFLDEGNLRGVNILSQSLVQLKASLRQQNEQSTMSEVEFEAWFKLTCNNWGFDCDLQREYRRPGNIHLLFESKLLGDTFAEQFAAYFPRQSICALSKENSVLTPPFLLDYLKDLYYRNPFAMLYSPIIKPTLKIQLDYLNAVKQGVSTCSLFPLLNDLHRLSQDYSNSKENGAELSSEPLAINVYHLALNIFYGLNLDNLSQAEALSLSLLVQNLVRYSPTGTLAPCLYDDSLFVLKCMSLYETYVKPDTPRPLSMNIPELMELIAENCRHKLQGGVFYPRFLPDEQGFSQTDELIFQGGGLINHSAFFRLIKVGIKEDGKRAEFGEKVHFYEYYLVTNDTGCGAFNVDLSTYTCTGNYVRKLRPCDTNNTFTPLAIDPYIDPKGYQMVMGSTLALLIIYERHLKFYRNPGAHPVFNAPHDSKEAYELCYMLTGRLKLAGTPHDGNVYYNYLDPSGGPTITKWTSNQRQAVQQAGSCALFSLNSYARSLLGHRLQTRFSLFMQLNDAPSVLKLIIEKICQLEGALKVNQAAFSPASTNPSAFFSGTENSTLTPPASVFSVRHWVS